MPRLSTYVRQQQAAGVASGAGGVPAVRPAGPRQGGAAQQEPKPGGAQLSAAFGAAAAKLKADYEKRLRDHGPRMFRWPDGQLRPEKPPPNPYAAANRQKWAELVRHCRTHGGDRSYDKNGYSLRYGINVPHSEHAAYMALIGLQPEVDESGRQVGCQEGVQNPLHAPDHCFNTFYKEAAEAVFKNRRGRLL